jgi:hypothetical protein
MFTAAELDEHWRHLRERAYGSVFQDLRWAKPMKLPAWPKSGEAISLSPSPTEPLYRQLETFQEKLGVARGWVGLSWADSKGLVNRIVDDAMMQGWLEGHEPASRMIVIDKDDEDVTVDREILTRGQAPIYFDTLGRELERTITLGAADFNWRLSPS